MTISKISVRMEGAREQQGQNHVHGMSSKCSSLTLLLMLPLRFLFNTLQYVPGNSSVR